MKKRKILSILMALVLATGSFAGCTGGQPLTEATESTASGTSAGTEAVSKTGYPIMNSDHTFKVAHAIANTDLVGSWENKDYSKKLQKDTGLKIEWVGINQNTYNDQVGILIAANDLPDTFMGGVPNFAQFVDSFTPLDELVAEYAPHAASFFEKYPEIKKASVFPDGTLYGLPQVQMNNFRTPNTLFINQKWLDTLKIKAPETLDELHTVLKAFKEQDANGNGDANDEIPLSFQKSESLTMYLAAFNIFGTGALTDPYPFLTVRDGKVVFYPEDESYREFLQYMNKLYSEGLVDPNGFVQEEQDIQAKGKNGQLGVFAGTSYIDILVGDRASEYSFLLPLKNKDGKRNYVPSQFSGDVNVNRFVVTKNCKYPAAMVRLYDYLNSSYENRLYFDWGQEGVAWEKTADGKIQRLNTTVPEGYSNYAEVRHTLSMGTAGSLLWDDDDQDTFAVTNERDMAYYSRQKPLMEYAIGADEYIPVGQDTVENAQEIAVLLTEIRTYMDNFQAESIMKGLDEAKWQQHLANVKKFNADKYTKLRQEFYDRMKSLD